ncbi:MAG: phosphodiesterase, partial [Nanohaloarchaea archaeon SW_4_43_9]
MEVQDAVHGYIKLSEEEKRIVDSPAFQRLRRIRQLGFTSLIYPSATHTRFQHSLGVTHLTGKFADSLNLKDEKRKELRLAALFHDTGHGPFSHVSEMMSKQYGVSHEDFSCEVIDRLEG